MKKLNELAIAASFKLNSMKQRVRSKLKDDKGQFAMDNGVAMVIIVAVAAVLLALLIAYFKGDFSTGIKNNINNLFSQS